MNLISSILRQATRKDGDRLNILTGDTHEAYQTCMAATNQMFMSFPHKEFKTWNSGYRPVPSNYWQLKDKDTLKFLDIDVILSQNKFGQFQVFGQMAAKANIPLISLEHTLPMPEWDENRREACRKMRGHLNVFISEYSIEQWGFQKDDPTVRIVKHGIDTSLFKPKACEKQNRVLSVCNDWMNRDWCCNFSGYMRTASNMPCYVLGDTPGLSKPASSVEELVTAYQESRIFYNTSIISPVPTALMEAMSCGCAVVSTATCMIPEIIENGVNGFLSNDEDELTDYLHKLLADEELARHLGENARKTIEEKFNLQSFVDNWNAVFEEAAELNACH